jgi:hypothetical protein
MQITQEKLSITGDLQRATEKYSNSMNASKLVWTMGGTGTDGIKTDLTYNTIMKPSPLNDYTPVLVTNQVGKVVLDSTLAYAACGVPKDGGTPPNADARNIFLRGLMEKGVITRNVFNQITDPKNKLYSNVGIGGQPLDKTASFTMNINNMLTYTDKVIKSSKDHKTADGQEALTDTQRPLVDALAEKLQFAFGYYKATPSASTLTQMDFKSDGDGNPQNSNFFIVNGSRTTNTNFTLSDLFKEDIALALTGPDNDSNWWSSAFGGFVEGLVQVASLGIYAMCGGSGSVYDAIHNNWSGTAPEAGTISDEILKFVANLYDAFKNLLEEDQATIDSQALDYAFKATVQLLNQTTDLGSDDGYSSGPYNKAVTNTNNYNGWVYSAATKSGHCGTQAISLSNLAESFLTYYAQALGGYDSGYGIKTKAADSNYVTDDLNYLYIVENVYNKDLYATEEAVMTADFYNALFNNICLKGWTTIDEADVHDKDYLDHALKNAQLFLAYIHDDGNYYQNEYTRNGFVSEITDEDAIARAEAEYNKAKIKLNYKEERLDIDLKNVDMEISSLTAEYDSVKGLIGKNVEKTFSMFQ